MLGCVFVKNKKVQDVSKQVAMCSTCGAEKHVLTLICGHFFCVKCYNKHKHCIICVKPERVDCCC